MVRKRIDPDKPMKRRFTFVIDPVRLKEIDKMAEYLEITTGQLMRNLLDMAMDDVRIMKKLGILDVSRAYRRIMESRKKKPLEDFLKDV